MTGIKAVFFTKLRNSPFGIFKIAESTQVMPLPVQPASAAPLISALIPCNAGGAARVISVHGVIFAVFSIVRRPQVAPPVVSGVSIFMIYLRGQRVIAHPAPCQPVLVISKPQEPYNSMLIAVFWVRTQSSGPFSFEPCDARGVRGFCFAPLSFSVPPGEHPCFRVVIEKFSRNLYWYRHD